MIFKHAKNLKAKPVHSVNHFELMHRSLQGVWQKDEGTCSYWRSTRRKKVQHHTWFMSLEKAKLKVGGVEYKRKVQEPSVKDILCASPAERLECAKLDVITGTSINMHGQVFAGYSIDVTSIREVEIAYTKVKSWNTMARHVICAYRLPGTQFHELQDCVDDDEHGDGLFLLDILNKAEIENCAVFVARYYDDTHIWQRLLCRNGECS